MAAKLKAQKHRVADVLVQGHGSIVLLWPQNTPAKAWLYGHVDVAQTWGEGIVVEPRYLSPILEALEDAGFMLEE